MTLPASIKRSKGFHKARDAGLSRKNQLRPETYARELEYNKAWGKRNRDKTAAACAKYRRKLQRLFGRTDPFASWQHHMLLEERKRKKK